MADVQKLRVLVVDDHFLARRAVVDAMRAMNVTDVLEAPDGITARDALNAAYESGKPFDVLFLDWNIPHLDGIEVLKHFRARQEFNSTAFIMFTSASEQSDVAKAIDAGATGYLIKPVTRESISKKLLEAVTWLKQQKSEKEA
jgi:two-component system, chemotaxis family, chemotaxis protein CheY